MTTQKIDLHVHSYCSDGELSPEQVCQEAKRLGLYGLSITDHDTTSAYPSVLNEAKELGLKMITGAEFSSSFDGCPVDILAYSFIPDKLAPFVTFHQQRRYLRNKRIVYKLQQLGIELSEQDLQSLASGPEGFIGRPHIALALVNKGVVKTIDEAFSIYLGDHKKAYVLADNPSITATIDTIHKAGGLAFIAHPHLLRKPHLFERLINFPFDGIEGYYGWMPHERNAPFIKAAQKKGLLVSGGSDFHGSRRPKNYLGASSTPIEVFERLLSHYESHQ